MPPIVDFVLPRRPVSHQAKNGTNKDAWRDFVYGRAMRAWRGGPLVGCSLKFTMVFLSDDKQPGDINNFVKPVQDVLCALIYADDSMIQDVSAHVRFFGDPMPLTGLPDKLAEAVLGEEACVYVAVHLSRDLAEELR